MVTKFVAVLLISNLILSTPAKADDAGIIDTIRISVDTLRIGESMPFTIYFFNDDPLTIASLAYEFIPLSGGFAIYDSAVFLGRLADPTVMPLRGVFEGNIDGNPTDTIGIFIDRMAGNSLPSGAGVIAEIYLTGIAPGQLEIAGGEYPPIPRNVVIREASGSEHYPFLVIDTAIVIESDPPQH